MSAPPLDNGLCFGNASKTVTTPTLPSRLAAACLLSLALAGCGSSGRSVPNAQFAELVKAPPLPTAPPVRSVAFDPALAERARLVIDQAADAQQAQLRANAVESAQQLPPEEAERVIAARLDDAEPRVRFAAAMAAGQLRLIGVKPRLEEMAEGQSPNGRVAAVYALARLGDYRLAKRLEQYAVAPDPVVRANTAIALGLLGEPTALRVLRVMREDADPNVRLNVAEAMWRLGDPAGFEALLAATLSEFSDDQTIATLALSGPRDPRAIPALEGKLVGEYPEVTLAAARGLGELGVDRGFGIARDHAGDDAARRRTMSALALGDIGRLDGQATLAGLLADRDPAVRLAAAAATLKLERVARDTDQLRASGAD